MADIGADSTAIAWVIAKNQEQANSFQQQKKNYRKGVIDGNGNDGKLEEDFETDDTFIDIDYDDPSGEGNDGNGEHIFDLNPDGGGIHIRFASAETDPDTGQPLKQAHVHVYKHPFSCDMINNGAVFYSIRGTPAADVYLYENGQLVSQQSLYANPIDIHAYSFGYGPCFYKRWGNSGNYYVDYIVKIQIDVYHGLNIWGSRYYERDPSWGGYDNALISKVPWDGGGTFHGVEWTSLIRGYGTYVNTGNK